MSNFSVLLRHEVGLKAWDTFVEASDSAWLWHRYEVIDALELWENSEDASFAILDSEGSLIAVVPLHLITWKKLPFLALKRGLSTGGPALRNGLGEKKERKLLSFLSMHIDVLLTSPGITDIELRYAPLAPCRRGPECPSINPSFYLGMADRSVQTWIVPMHKTEEELWIGLEGRARTAIRKTASDGLVAKAINPTDGFLDRYYQSHVETCKRTGVTPRPKQYFLMIRDCFVKNGKAIFVAVEEGENLLAAGIFGVDKQSAIYWSGTASVEGQKRNANVLMVWHAMQILNEQGIQYFETGEACIAPASGKHKDLSNFKKSFGGVLYPYYSGVRKSSSRGLEVLRAMHSLRVALIGADNAP